MSLLREIIFVATICCTNLLSLAALGNTIVILPYVGADFGIADSPGQLSWTVAAYSLAVGTFILPAGKWGDVYGHKRMVVVGYLWFAIWSMATGFSRYGSNIIAFDICRGFQGIGPALLLPNSLAILGRAYNQPDTRQSVVFSLFGAVAPNGFLLGAIFAGIFAQKVWWPWTFWTLGIACFAMAIICCFVIPKADDDGGMMPYQKGQLDLPGTVTGVASLVLINVAWNQGSGIGWVHPETYILLIIGFCILGLFFWFESRASHPIFPYRSLNSDVAFTLACVAAGWSSFGIWIFYLCEFFQTFRKGTPLQLSAWLTPAALSGIGAAITTAFLLQKLGPGSVMLLALTFFTIGSILVATAPVGQTYWAQTFIAILLTPWGMDMSFPSATIILSNALPRTHQGIAASLVSTVVNYSISLGLGFAGTVESSLNHQGHDVLRGYRSAWYMGIGLAGLGWVVAAAFVLTSFQRRHKEMIELT